jgi:hypothetical protein
MGLFIYQTLEKNKLWQHFLNFEKEKFLWEKRNRQ